MSLPVVSFSTDAGSVTVKQDHQTIEFLHAINALNAHSGGDCPEYTFQGILNALGQMPLLGSPMYVFTDAGPKDATTDNIELVKLMAEADEITINFISTGTLEFITKFQKRQSRQLKSRQKIGLLKNFCFTQGIKKQSRLEI